MMLAGEGEGSGAKSGNMDVIRRVVGQSLAVFVVAHRRLEIFVAQVGLHLLRLGASFNRQRATSVAKHMCSYCADSRPLSWRICGQ